MTKYMVNWVGSRTEPPLALEGIEAENCRDAFNKMVAEHKCPSHPKINVSKLFGDAEQFDNPHYDLDYILPGKIQESHSLQPQSSGWATFHNVCGWVGIAIIFIGLFRIIDLYVRIRHNPDEKVTVNEFELMWQNTFGLIELGIIVTIANFFMAFFINVITEIQNNTRLAVEYQKRTVNVLENWGK